MTWQPISTAPKDDRIIDIWSVSEGRCCNYRRVDLGLNNVFYDPDVDGPCTIRDATHWMQIPDAPDAPPASQDKPVEPLQPCPACKRMVAVLAAAVEAWGWCANRK